MTRPFGRDLCGAAAPHRRGATPPGPFGCARLLAALVLLCLAPAAVAAATVTVLPLGDSITHGTDAYPSYRPLLYQDLRDLGYDVDFVGSSHTPALAPGLDPDNEGHPNYTAGDVRAALPGWLGAYPPPDVVLLHLGTNDAIYWVPRDRTIADLTAIVGQLRSRNPEVTVLVARIIPTSVASTNTRIQALNAAIGGLAELSTARSPVVVVDQYSGYDGVADNQRGGVHPLTSGELKMAARWKAALVPVLDRLGAGGGRTYGPHPVPGRIEAEDYDTGGFVDTTAGNAGNAYRSDDVDIEYAAGEGSFAVGWIRTGESLSYTANVTVGGPYRLSARVSSPHDGRQIAVTADGTTVAVVPVSNTGSFEAYATVTVDAALGPGTRRLTLTFTGDGQNLNWLDLAPGGPVATSTVPPLPPADVAGLSNATFEPTLITWTWTDPADPLFANVTVLLDGVPAATVERGVQAFTATGLSPGSEHTVSTRTRNALGVASATWANHTARTAPGTVEPTATATPAPTPTPSGPQAPYPSARTLPSVVEAEHFDAGGEGVAYHDVDPWNIGGDGSRAGEGVDIETDGGVTDVCYVRAGEYLEYSVDAGAAGSYALALRAANPDAGAKAVKVYLDGVPVGEVLVAGTGSWTVYRDFTGPGPLAIPTGRHVVTLAFEGVERVNLDRLAFTVAAPTGTPTPTATVSSTPTVTATGPTPDATPTVEVTPSATATETPEPTPTAEATPSVTGTPPPVPVPVPSAAGAPLDPDGDGAYEDVNGNGRADFADVTLLFEALAWCAEHEPAAVFDFNANGRIDFADVVALFDGL